MPIILPSADLLTAWKWLSAGIPARPAPNASFVYNDLATWNDLTGRLLNNDAAVISKLVALYLGSHAGKLVDLLRLVNDDTQFDVNITGAKLDAEVKKLYSSKTRFRASLGEHLAFWITAAQQRALGAFRMTSPHHLAEDKGPDGIVLRSTPAPSCEIISVKQSPSNIVALIASGPFRRGRAPRPKKMLDDLFRFAKKGYGFARVEKMVSEMMSADPETPPGLAADALLATATYQAVALSSHALGAQQLYNGFDRIAAPPARCVATYVGSLDWERVAVSTRAALRAQLQAVGVW